MSDYLHHKSMEGCSGSEVTLLAMNLSGRFTGREIRRYGEAVLGTVLVEKDADLLFGQQANFQPRLPDQYVLLGKPKAFLAYNKARLKACDEKTFKNKLSNLQIAGKLPFHYLPLTNLTVTKFKTRKELNVEFIAVSWLSDETKGRLRCLSLFRKLITFIENISKLEKLPVIVAGTFNITLDDASQCLPDNYCVYGYIPDNTRRQTRAADFFVCPRTMRLGNICPILCSHMEFNECSNMWLNPEDAFYCDPVRATLIAEHQDDDKKLQVVQFSDDQSTRYHDDDTEMGNRSLMTDKQSNKMLWNDPDTGLLKKLPSCSDLYDTEAENSNTCYMS